MNELVVTQNSDTHYECVPYDKTNAVVVNGGAPVTVEFQVRDSGGRPVDLSGWFPAEIPAEEQPYAIATRISFADNSRVAKQDIIGNAVDPVYGKIQFELPEYVYNVPCIYYFYWKQRFGYFV